MALLKEEKEQIVQHFRSNELDTGSSEVQVALLTFNIVRLTEHLKKNKKDHHSRRGLLSMVNKRKKLLKYAKNKKPEVYQKLLKELNLRK